MTEKKKGKGQAQPKCITSLCSLLSDSFKILEKYQKMPLCCQNRTIAQDFI